MMTADQAKTVAMVFRHFLASEQGGWNEIDDFMDHLDYLDDDQLHREADVAYEGHKNKNPRCNQKHDKSACLVPSIVEAVGIILDLYKDTGNLHRNNKYVLQYYLALNQAGLIVID